MPRRRSWTEEELKEAVKNARSYRAVLIALNLVPAGGNYVQIQNCVKKLDLSTSHFTGMGWNIGLQFKPNPPQPLESLLVLNSKTQSFLLKKRLFSAGIKKPQCELCGWNKKSLDGRIPVELDHINGNKNDNRLDNLRVLCPNCHSLQSTHRGRNKKCYLASPGVVTGSQN